MTREEITEFLEAYRDGAIEPDDARRLAREIRNGGPNASWAMEELAFSGWISEALSTLDPDSFVRSFLERLYAERSVEQFSSSLTHRLEKERSYDRTKAKTPLLGHLPVALQMMLGVSAGAPASSHKHRCRLIVAACLFLIIVGAGIVGGIWIYREIPATNQVAVIESASAGTLIARGAEQLSASNGSAVNQADRLVTSVDGYARVKLVRAGAAVLTSDTVAVFGPPTDRPSPDRNESPQPILVEQGEVLVKLTKNTPFIVNTPHGRITAAGPANFIITVTAQSTRAKSRKGTLSFTRFGDGKSVRVPANHYAIATDSLAFEAHPLRE